MNEDNPYENLRLDVLQRLISERNIPCKIKKGDIIEQLILDDSGKYIRETIYEKQKDGLFKVGIDIRNKAQLIQLGHLVEKKEAHCLKIYHSNMLWYISNQKLI